MKNDIKWLEENNLIIFKGICGSQAYGTATENSDIDIKGVFMMPLYGLLNFDYVEQVSDETNDTTYYELKRFLQLLQTNNPNILELLNLPAECILYKDPIFDIVLDQKEKFISKVCKHSFGGYAVEQIRKARGLNKKIVKKFDETRKGVLDFCYVAEKQGSILVEDYLKMFNDKHQLSFTQEDISLVAIPHMRFTYGAYVAGVEKISTAKGIVHDREKSNDVSLSTVPKGFSPIFIMQFNKDGFSTYCREYKEYHEWVAKRNVSRFNDNMMHGKGFDGKNIAHCHRLLDMAIEIGEGKGINVKRQNREFLLGIRKGEYEYDDLIREAEEKIKKMDEVFEHSDLPESLDFQYINDLLLAMRYKKHFPNFE